MRNIFLLLCLVCVEISLGSPLQAHGVQWNMTCAKDPSYHIKIAVCTMESNSVLHNKLTHDDMKNKTKIDGLLKKCSEATTCLNSLSHCHIFGIDRTPLVENIVYAICDYMKWAANTPCNKKLESYEGECSPELNPFMDPHADEEKKKEKCDNFFGKNGCLRDTMVKWCGSEEWVQYRDLMLNLNDKVFKQCEINAADWN
ncbi:unnamed protein product [Caenorhabditis nigoni]